MYLLQKSFFSDSKKLANISNRGISFKAQICQYVLLLFGYFNKGNGCSAMAPRRCCNNQTCSNRNKNELCSLAPVKQKQSENKLSNIIK